MCTSTQEDEYGYEIRDRERGQPTALNLHATSNKHELHVFVFDMNDPIVRKVGRFLKNMGQDLSDSNPIHV